MAKTPTHPLGTPPAKHLGLSPALYQYLQLNSLREPEVLRQLRDETSQLPAAIMQISPEQGQLMALLVQLMGARKTLEVGVFTGYSSLVVALALPPEGRLVACDVDANATAIAQRYWQAAGVADKIDLKLGPAIATLDALLRQAGEVGSYDFAFIDADKGNYPRYYEQCLQLIRPGGLIAIDNVLWSGRVANPDDTDKRTQILREFNATLHLDERVQISLIPIADGLTLALKR